MHYFVMAGLCVILCVAGCGEQGAPSASPGESPTSPQAAPADKAATKPALAEVKPEYGLEIKVSESDPKQYTVIWTARVPTSGWKMTTDSVLVEESMGSTWARIWAILEQPGPGDPVTATPETLTGTHEAGQRVVDKAELSIKRTTRGETPQFAPLYVEVKRIGNR